MAEKEQLQQDIYSWINKIKPLIDEGYELGDRVGRLSISCVTVDAPEVQPELQNCGSSITYPHTFTWSTAGAPAGSNIDIWINNVDIAPSVPAINGQLTVASGPTGTISVDMYLIESDGTVTLIDSCEYTATMDMQGLNLLKDIVPAPSNKNPLTLSDWQSFLSPNYVFFTGDVSLTSVVNNNIRVVHPAGQATDLCTVCAINDSNKRKYRVRQEITFAPNWTPGQSASSEGGKSGWGLSGGSYVSSGGINVIVSGGSSATTGYSIRPGFRGYNLIGYAYYANRPGMPTTGQLFGEDIGTGVTIVPGQTYLYEIEICLNTPGVADGEIRIFVNDSINPVAVRSNVLFMDGTPEANRGFFCSNHGGAGAQWAPDEDTYIEYGNIQYQISST